jgi:hypothetical protein
MKAFLVNTLTVVALVFVIGCSQSSPPNAPIDSSLSSGNTPPALGTGDFGDGGITSLPSAVTDGLMFMREEEKLARDVYTALAKKWNLRQFSTIASSEQRHMDALRTLIVRYSLNDPVGSNGPGVFVNGTLQALYQQLLEKGTQSVQDAFQVGRLIEETDITDLDNHIAELTTESDIMRVYTNLREGSLQHLAAFTRHF